MTPEFLEHLRAKRYAPNTVAIYQKWLEHFASHCPGPLEDLKPADLTRYHKALHWEPGSSGKLYSENTVNQAVGVVRAYLRWCVEQGFLKKSPAGHLQTHAVPKKQPVYLTPGQARKLLALPDLDTSMGLRDRAILGLLVEEQASPPALSRLDLADFQADTGAVLLKGRKRRILCLGTGLQADLERYIRLGRTEDAKPGEKALFISRFGTRLQAPGMRAVIATYCRQADVPRPSFFS